MADAQDKVDSLRDRIEDSDAIDDEDRNLLLAFSDELFFLRNEYSYERHLKLLSHLTILSGESVRYDRDQLPDLSLAAALEDEAETKAFVQWIHETPLINSEETNRDYRVALRMFGQHVTPGDDKPDSIEIISSTTPRNYDPAPDPAKMLWWDEHIVPMIDAAQNFRDKAAIAVSWDLGGRSGEFRELRLGDVSDHRHGLKVTVQGKTGQRSPLLIPSVPHLQRWRDVHPRKGDNSAPLWCHLQTGEDVSYNSKQKMLVEPGKRADVVLPAKPTFTRMRKSRASDLASKNIRQAFIEDRMGWTRGSTVAARYIATFSETRDRELAKAHGLDVSEEEPEPTGPVPCPRCDRDNPREEDFCVWCDQALEEQAVEELRTDEKKVQRMLLKFARQDASLLEDAEKRDDIAEVLADNPELQRRAKDLVDELDLAL